MKNINGEHESLYEDVTVDWKKHKTPVLIIYEDNEEVERIMLANFDDINEMHELMATHGFQKGDPALMNDSNTDAEVEL